MTRKRTETNMKNLPIFIQILVVVISICVGYGLKSAKLDEVERVQQKQQIDIKENGIKIDQERVKNQSDKDGMQKALAELATGQAVMNAKLDMLMKRLDEKRLDKNTTSLNVAEIRSN